jgi:hypothetical protein
MDFLWCKSDTLYTRESDPDSGLLFIICCRNSNLPCLDMEPDLHIARNEIHRYLAKMEIWMCVYTVHPFSLRTS